MATRIYKTPFAATGDKEALAAADQPDGKVSLQAGWTPDYELPNDNANYRPVGRSEMNGIFNEVTEGLGDLQLNGFAIWQAVDGGWPLGAIVKHGSATYSSLIGNNGDEPGNGSGTWVPVLTNNATTTVAGILRLATTAQAQALTDDTAAITPLKLSQAVAAATGYQAFTTPGVSTFNRPAGVSKVKVRVYGGGGGGASDTASAPAAGGGAEGGYWEGIFDISAVSSVSVTVGTGGAGAPSIGNNGSPGTASSFGVYASAQGGSGGVRTLTSPPGGTSTGASGFGWQGAPGSAAISGAGGATVFGGAGGGAWSPYAATDAGRPPKPGVGGGGRISSAGAPGAHGAVIIEW